MKALLKTVGALFAFLVVFGLVASTFNPEITQSQSQEESEGKAAQGENTVPEPQPQPAPQPGIIVTKDEYGDAWPFTSEEGRIECRHGGALVFIVRDFEYQLNGLAEQMGYTKINSIWRWNPDIPTTRIPLTPIIQRAKSLC